MPVVSGEQVARMIRSTNNHNQNTPSTWRLCLPLEFADTSVIAATSYEQHQSITEEGTLFSAVLAKPVSKVDLVKCLGKLGFVLTSTGSQTTTSDAVSAT
jgi:serine/threonine-protein kinase RIM15